MPDRRAPALSLLSLPVLSTNSGSSDSFSPSRAPPCRRVAELAAVVPEQARWIEGQQQIRRLPFSPSTGLIEPGCLVPDEFVLDIINLGRRRPGRFPASSASPPPSSTNPTTSG